jgi:hypothetical protein
MSNSVEPDIGARSLICREELTPMKRPQPKQPTVTARTRTEPHAFHGQELPDPEGHLTEEQRKWPVVTELLPVGSTAGTAVVEPMEATPKLPPVA